MMATIFGLFPPGGFNSLFGADEVDAAMARFYRDDQLGNAAVILGGDVARQGDDNSAVCKRRGARRTRSARCASRYHAGRAAVRAGKQSTTRMRSSWTRRAATALG